MPTTAKFLGNSWTAGYGLSSGQEWPALLGADLGWTVSNLAVSGSMSQESGQCYTAYLQTITSSDVSLWLAGLNNYRFYGTDVDGLSDTVVSLEAGFARLLVPTASLKLFSDATYTGSGWQLPLTLAPYGVIKYSNTATDYCEFTVSGSSVLIGTARATSNTGAVEIKVDGVVKVASFSTSMHSTTGGDGSGGSVSTQPALIKITGLSNTSHTVRLTVLAGGGYGYFNWAVGLDGSSPGPKLYVGGAPTLPSAGYSVTDGGGQFGLGSNTIASTYSAAIKASCDSLAALGLDIHYAPVNVNLSQFQADNVHPNPTGHQQVSDCFKHLVAGDGFLTLTNASPSSGTTNVASGNFTVGIRSWVTMPVGSTLTVTPSLPTNVTATPSSVSISSSVSSATFTITPTTSGAKSIGLSENRGYPLPVAVTYTANDPVPLDVPSSVSLGTPTLYSVPLSFTLPSPISGATSVTGTMTKNSTVIATGQTSPYEFVGVVSGDVLKVKAVDDLGNVSVNVPETFTPSSGSQGLLHWNPSAPKIWN